MKDNGEAALRREVDLAVADEPEFTPTGTTGRKQVSLDRARDALRPPYTREHSGTGQAGIKRHGHSW